MMGGWLDDWMERWMEWVDGGQIDKGWIEGWMDDG